MALIQKLSAGAWLGAAFAVVAFSFVVSGQEDDSQKQPQAPEAQQSEQRPAPSNVIPPDLISVNGEKAVEADWSKPDCERPQDHNEADLCQQRRMAEAAEKTVTLNQVQIGIGLFTILGLAFTVYYTRKTAEAAVIAAGAAKESADAAVAVESPRLHIVIKSDSLRSILRAAIHYPNSPEMDGGSADPNKAVVVFYYFKNYGKTPAIIKEISLGKLVFGAVPPIPVYTVPARPINERMIAPGGQTERDECVLSDEVTIGQSRQILAGNAWLWFYGRVIYTDVFGREHWHRFYWRFNGPYPLSPYDYKRYNEDFSFVYARPKAEPGVIAEARGRADS